MIYIMKNDKQLVIRLSEELKDNFNKHCEKNGYSVSKRLRTLIDKDISNGNSL
jgi:predicted DNA-binding protein